MPSDPRSAAPSLGGRAEARRQRWLVVGAALGLYVGFAAWIGGALGHRFLISDPRIYWQLSFFAEPFHEWWVPGYPALLAAVRIVTGLGDGATVLLLISAAGFVAGALGTHELAREAFRGTGLEAHAVELALLFCLFPFVGLTWAVHPVADSVTLALVVWAAVLYRRSRPALFAVVAAVALLTHKASWIVVACLAATSGLFERRRLPWVLASTLPLGGWLVAGAIATGDALWFARWSAEHLMSSRSSLPLLDGLIGTLLFRGMLGLAKSVVLLPTFALAAWVLARSLDCRDALFAALAGSLVVMGLILNQYEIWALVRFAKLLVVPAALLASRSRPALWRRWASSRRAWMLLYLFGMATNVAWAFYMRHYFAAGG